MRKYIAVILCNIPLCVFAGEIMENDTIIEGKTIQEVVVTGREIVVKEDKLIINVSNKVKKHSFDGYSALSLLTIPGMKVDAFSGSVSTNGDAAILCINGREASKDEIKTLNPKDIKRIDYYQQAHPEHPMARGGVIDFIMRTRESGGMVTAQASQHLNMLSGDGMADWKTFRKKSEFGIQFSDTYRHFTPSRGTEETVAMAFDDGNVRKETVALPSPVHSNGIKGQMSFLQRMKRGTLKIVASFRDGHDMRDKMMRQTFFNGGVEETDACDFTHKDYLSPALSVQYRHKFKNKATVTASLNGDYTRTEQDRDYSSLQAYHSRTEENFTHLRPALKITCPASKNITSFLSAAYYHDRSSTYYRENEICTRGKLTNGQAHLVGGATFLVIPSKLSLSLQLEERIMTVDDGNDRTTSSFFTPSLFYGINMPHGNILKGRIGMGAFTPQMKYYTRTEKRIDEYQIITGNPDQRIDYSVQARLTFSSIHKWGNINVNTWYEKNKRPLYESVMCDNERDVYIHTFVNGGSYEHYFLNSTVQLNVIPHTLSVEAGAEYSYVKGHFQSRQTMNTFYPIAELKFINKGLQCSLTFAGKRKDLTQNGCRIDNPAMLKLALGYTANNLNVSLYADNPFMTSPVKKRYAADGFSDVTANYSPRTDCNMFAVRVSYRFTYGKKHKFEHIETDDVNRSAILDAETK